MLHGGAPSGLIASIVQNLPSDVPMSVTRLTIDLQRPVPVGPLDIEVNITREGRNIQTSEVILSANGKQVVRASGLKIRKAGLELPEASAMPEVAGTIPETPIGFPRAVGFNTAVVMRTEDPAATSRKAVWFHIKRPFLDSQETTPLMRAAATGDYCNGFGSTLDFEEWTFINADLTLHFAREPVGEWIKLEANSWISPDGRGLGFGELSDQHGPFGRAVQSLVIAKR
jgi:acyl-CoA thioesterase